MSWTIEPFDGASYNALAALHLAVEPEYGEAAEVMRDRDARHDLASHHGRLVAVENGQYIGTADFHQPREQFYPGSYWGNIAVLPERQGQGLGADLYKALLAALEPRGLADLNVWAAADHSRATQFMERRGYTEALREWESRLDITAFNPNAFAGAAERVEKSGIRIYSLAELASSPECYAKVTELMNVLEDDVPAPVPATPMEVEQFQREELGSVTCLPEAWFLALDGDHYAGYTALWKDPARPKLLDTGLTGVRREYRRRGIAMALKLRAVRFAQEYGATEIRTWNATSNDPMLSINVALGFRRHRAWIQFRREFQASSGNGEIS